MLPFRAFDRPGRSLEWPVCCPAVESPALAGRPMPLEGHCSWIRRRSVCVPVFIHHLRCRCEVFGVGCIMIFKINEMKSLQPHPYKKKAARGPLSLCWGLPPCQSHRTRCDDRKIRLCSTHRRLFNVHYYREVRKAVQPPPDFHRTPVRSVRS